MKLVRVHPSGWGFCERDGGPAFTPWGCNYYDPFTGWPPRLWEQFDPGRVAEHFGHIREIGGNIVRVFATVANVMASADRTSPAGIAKMVRLLDLAERAGLRVIWSGPSLWEGAPVWWNEHATYECYARPDLIAAQQVAWRGLGHAMTGHPALFAWELHNEPFAPWRATPALREAWHQWKAKSAPHAPDDVPTPPEPLAWDWSADFQRFREHIAESYTRAMVGAIREVDDTHLITIGLHQKSAPFDWYPPDPYAAFNPHRLVDLVDYTSVHFYPHHIFHPNLYLDPADSAQGMTETLLHGRAVLRYVYAAGKPVVLEECGWYGGGSVFFANREQPARTEVDQTAWCRGLVEATRGDACGWLFWPYRDTPSSLDSSKRSGFFDADGRLKDWGRAFAALSPEITATLPVRHRATCTLPLSWERLVTDPGHIKAVRAAYLAAFQRGETVDFELR